MLCCVPFGAPVSHIPSPPSKPREVSFSHGCQGKEKDACSTVTSFGLPWWLSWWRICLSMQEMPVQSLGRETVLGEEVATHSRILAWEMAWTEESGGLQSMGSQRVRLDWATKPKKKEKTSPSRPFGACTSTPVHGYHDDYLSELWGSCA